MRIFEETSPTPITTATLTGRRVIEGMGRLNPFQVAMTKYLFDEDEEPIDPKWYEEDGTKSYSIHKNTLR